MSDSKHWLLEIPLLKGIALGVIIIHIIALPLLTCLFEYPAFFKNTELLKLILVCAGIGSIITCIAGFIIGCVMTAKTPFRVANLENYSIITLFLVVLFLLLDLTIIPRYLLSSIYPEHKLIISVLLLGSIVLPVVKLSSNGSTNTKTEPKEEK